MSARWWWAGLALGLIWVGPEGAAAQQMGQGEARITARSDVRLSLESRPGTGAAEIAALGQRVGARMTELRTCYEEAAAETPTLQGVMRLEVRLEGRRGPPRIEVVADEVGSRELMACIQREITRMDVAGLSRPTAAMVVLEFANTAAEGATRMAGAVDQARQVEVTEGADGRPEAEGGAADGRLRFTVRGAAGEREVVAAAQRALMSGLAPLLDCRRRAGRRGQSPAGEIAVTMRIREGQPPASRVLRSTVGDARARTCVSRALSQIQRRASEGSGAVEVTIRFFDDAEARN